MSYVMEKTWHHSWNNPYVPGSVADCSQWTVWMLKSLLLGQTGTYTDHASTPATRTIAYTDANLGSVSPTGVWTCVGSCAKDPTLGWQYNMTGTDLWGTTYDATKLENHAAGQNHAWIVLKKNLAPSLPSTYYYLIIDLTGTTDNKIATYYMSKNAPTGGSTTTRPASTNEWGGTNGWLTTTLNDSTAAARKTHFILSTTGDALFLTTKDGSNVVSLAMLFSALSSPQLRSSDPYPIFTGIGYNVLGVLQIPGAYGVSGGLLSVMATSGWGWIRNAADSTQIWSTIINMARQGQYPLNWSTGGSSRRVMAHPMESSTYAFPCWVIAGAALGNVFLKGRLADFMLGPLGAENIGEPRQGTVKSSIIGELWVPANKLIQY